MTFGSTLGVYSAVGTAVVLCLLFAITDLRLRRALSRANATGLRRMSVSRSRWRHSARRVLLVCGVCLCLLAASGPRVSGHITTEQHGIDLVLVMDFSSSMLAADMTPGRIEHMTRAADRLLDRAIHDRVGVVVFAGVAAHFPLTHDRRAARSMYHGLRVNDLPQGSNLAQAVRLARGMNELDTDDDPRRPRTRAIVIMTDGEQTDGDARREIEIATRTGIEVYLVGFGTSKGARVPDLDPRGYQIGWKQRADGTPVRSRLDKANMLALAHVAGGPERLFVFDGKRSRLTGLNRALDALQRGALRSVQARHHRDVYEWFLFPGFVLLIIEACMSTRRRRMLYP